MLVVLRTGSAQAASQLEACVSELVIKATAAKFPPLSISERAIRAAILDAISRIQASVSTQEIMRALEVGDIEGAVELVRFELGEEFLLSILPAHLRKAYEISGASAAVETGSLLGVGYSFNIITPRAVDWVRMHAGGLIQQWGDSSRDALRRLIAQGFANGTTASALARQIKNTGIGLTWRQARAVLNMRHRLEADGVPASKIDARAERYFNRLLRERAEMIARTEITSAMTNARLEAWRQAADKGLLDTTHWEKEWLATQDARVCEFCADLDGSRAAVPDGVFVGDSGTIGGTGPGYHPRCRCTVMLVEIGSKPIPRARPNITGDPGIRPQRVA